MHEYKRSHLSNKYHQLEIYDCPTEIIALAAQQASEYVTIENFMHYNRTKADFRFQVVSKEFSLIPSLKRFNIDFSISKKEFLQLMDLWDEEGCYAVFHHIAPLKFKATDLEEMKRYPALENFGWTLEISVGSAASSGWSYITSPDEQLINKIENYIKQLY